ncbi:hypothetical protein [Roseateles oligotrophus]|uniref:Uncharacterized protein n=1 Tax=Roseateles oligotrophus TaxID=1769250 RepID=A0ABT2YKC5_9BURK|nr:hypothetical protein [Roseateles oligotrophus]MCV2370520.1 hypothetical protein [Roseateles oligotrophus]
MKRSIESMALPLAGRWQRVALSLAFCAASLAGGLALSAPVEPLPGGEIIAISMEKDCFGCSTGERLHLRRDGLASLALTGKARHRTQDETSLGAIGSDDFEALARLTLAQGFFAMQDSYEDPQIRDGAWTLIKVECSGGTSKQVFRREREGPTALNVIESAMAELRGRIVFERKHP